MPTKKPTKKYRLLKNDTKTSPKGKTLYRIEALRDFSTTKKGEKGGYIEKESNLSQEGNAWVSGNAQVCGDAWVYGNARVSERFDLSVSIDFELPRITIDTKEKLDKLRKFLEEF